MNQNVSGVKRLVPKLSDVGKPRVGHFAMVSDEALEAMDSLIKTAPQAARLLNKLVRLMQSGSGGVIVVSRTTLSELLEVSIPTVGRAITVLSKGGWVQPMRISGAYALAINCRIAWRGDRDGIQHAVFSATVVASRSEQDAAALNPPPMREVPISVGAEQVIGNGGYVEPPSQRIIPGVEPSIQTELEAHGQQRLAIDPDTGEYLKEPK